MQNRIPDPPKELGSFQDRKWRELIKRLGNDVVSLAETSVITTDTESNIPNSRVLTGSTNIEVTDNGAGSTVTLDLTNTGVTPNTYTNSTITVDSKGRITSASSGGGGGGVSDGDKGDVVVSGGGATWTVETALLTKSYSVNVDFGTDGDTATASVAAPWVTVTSKIVCVPAAVATADHDPEDYALEEIIAYPTNLQVGVGFDVIAKAPNSTHGLFTINCLGI